MTANPTTFYVPENRDLYEETAAEILTGAKTYHALPKEKQEELKKEFSERVLRYFDKLDIAPTLDNILLHQENLRKEISYEIEEETQIEEDYEDILGLGKKAKAKREAKKSESANGTDWGTGGSWNKDNKTIKTNSVASAFSKPQKGWDANRTGAGTSNPQWGNTITSILGASTQVLGAIQAGKQNPQQDVQQQQGIFPNPEPRKPKILGLEPVVGIAIIILILAVFGFLIWQISQKQ